LIHHTLRPPAADHATSRPPADHTTRAAPAENTTRATVGDAALVRGDGGRAARAYRNRVVERPGDDAAWTGLALVCAEPALRDRIEVVAAVYRALDGAADDPVTLATWLADRL
jgi:hypothetical protein